MSLGVTSSDIEVALGRDPGDVTHLIDTASDLVVGYLGGVPANVDPAVIRVVADMVAACLTKPAVSVSDYSAGGYNATRETATVRVGEESATTTGPWLTRALKMRLNPFCARRRAFTITPVGADG